MEQNILNNKDNTLSTNTQICRWAKYFNKEVDLIKTPIIRKAIQDFIEECVPDYFFKIPASTSGKYHPQYVLGEGGLVCHTRAAIKLAVSMFALHNFSQVEKDIIVSALLLHDCFKCGVQLDYEESHCTKFEHPVICASIFNSFMEKFFSERTFSMFNREWSYLISNCICCHMGKWNTSSKSDCILPEPRTYLEKYVHLCDYLASRRFVEVLNLDNIEE